MTLSDAAKHAAGAASWAAGHLTLVLAVALAAMTFLSVRSCNRAGRAEEAHAKAVENAQVAARGVAVAQETERAGLERQLAGAIEVQAAATGQASTLSEQVKALLGAASGAHVIEVQTGDTGWVPTSAPPAGGAPEPGGGPSNSPSATPPGRVCLLYEGDEGRIQTDQVRARYEHGTVGVVGTADAFGRAPGAEPRHLFGGPLKLQVAMEGAPRTPGWAWGAGAGISGSGVLGAVLVQTPPAEVPLVHWPARAWFLAAGGASQGLVLAGVSVEP